MSILILRLLVDFGLLVLIWMTQLIVYPGFLHYKTENLVTWHRKYSLLIGCIVGPLMLLQLGTYIYHVTNEIKLFDLVGMAMLCMIWMATFLQFVPIHNNISKGRVSKEMLLSLIKKNWLRTILWSTLFLINLACNFF